MFTNKDATDVTIPINEIHNVVILPIDEFCALIELG
jgi:hypothetical protein